MANLARSVATLRLMGDDLVPEEITRLLGCAPTVSYAKGSVRIMRSGRERVENIGRWSLDASPTEPENLDKQVAELLSRLTDDTDVWLSLSRRFRLDLFCGWFMKERNEGVSISPTTMLTLGERGIELSLDIYGQENDSTFSSAELALQIGDSANDVPAA